MGPGQTGVLRTRRPRWRAYLLLARVSNLPTVWTNVLAGIAAAGAAVSWPRYTRLSIAITLLYTGGMFLNDAFDAAFDARVRPDRPIPAGDVTRGEVFGVGFTLLIAGEVALAVGQSSLAPLVWGTLLGAAITYYDFHHKRNPLAPVVMGSCRGLVYCVAAAAATGGVGGRVAGSAMALTGYVVALTWVARRTAAASPWPVALLLAGISIVDAAVIALFGPMWLAWLAVSGFVLTLAFQRIVPGT
jgi:4-hydroxybenzoate polyprenyltransferase